MAGKGCGGIVRVAVLEGTGCGGCVQEALAALLLRESKCARLVEAVAHADLLLLCGDFPAPLREAVQAVGKVLSAPWGCIRVGDCAGEPVWEGERRVAGCPPRPEEILRALVEMQEAGTGGGRR
ncbi:MAG: hypothetical protein ACP5SI_06115 [Chloroflexia bacterium]